MHLKERRQRIDGAEQQREERAKHEFARVRPHPLVHLPNGAPQRQLDLGEVAGRLELGGGLGVALAVLDRHAAAVGEQDAIGLRLDVGRRALRRLALGARLRLVLHRVLAVEREQLLVRAALDDDAVLQKNDLGRVANRREAMRDRDRRQRARDLAERLLHDSLRRRVESRRALVEQQNHRIANQRARNRDALLLAAREARRRLLAHHRVVALRQLRDKVVAVGALGGANHLLLGRRRRARIVGDGAEQNVVANRSRKEHRLLRHQRDAVAQRANAVLLDRHAVDQHLARGGPVPALEQADTRRLARSGATDQRERLAGLDDEAEALEHLDAGARRIGEAHVAKLDAPANVLGRAQRRLVGGGVDVRVAIDHVVERCGDATRRGERRQRLANHAERHGTDQNGEERHKHVADVVEAAVVEQRRAVPERERLNELHDEQRSTDADAVELHTTERLLGALVDVGVVERTLLLLAAKRVHEPHGAERLGGDRNRVGKRLLALTRHLRHEATDEETDADEQRRAADNDETELPRLDEADNEAANKRGQRLKDHRHAIETLLHQINVARHARHHLAGRLRVVPANLLAQQRAHIVQSNAIAEPIGHQRAAEAGQKPRATHANAEIDEVQNDALINAARSANRRDRSAKQNHEQRLRDANRHGAQDRQKQQKFLARAAITIQRNERYGWQFFLFVLLLLLVAVLSIIALLIFAVFVCCRTAARLLFQFLLLRLLLAATCSCRCWNWRRYGVHIWHWHVAQFGQNRRH